MTEQATINFVAIVLGMIGVVGLFSPRVGFAFMVLFALIALFKL